MTPKPFDGKVPASENGHGLLVPSVPTPTLYAPDGRLLTKEWDRPLMSDGEVDERCEALKDIVLGRANNTPWIHQGQQGSCATAAMGHCLMASNYAEGETVELLSQATLYAWDGIDSNGDPIPRRSDNGQALATTIRLAALLGMAPASLIDPLDYKGWRRWPDNWRQAADDNKLMEWRRTAGLQAIKTAIATPLPVLHGYGAHARMLVWRDPETGKWWAKNSWRDQHWHLLTDDQVDEGDGQYESFALIRTVIR